MLGCSAASLPFLLQRKPPGKMPSASQGRSSLERTWAASAHGIRAAGIGRERGRSPCQPLPPGGRGLWRARPLSRVLVLQSLRCHYHLGLHRISLGGAGPWGQWGHLQLRPVCTRPPVCLPHHPCRWVGIFRPLRTVFCFQREKVCKYYHL